MVETKAFAPVEYDFTSVSPGSVTSPPFDVIDAAMLEALRAKSPYNIVHLTLSQGKDREGKIPPVDADHYERVEQTIMQWLEQGLMVERKDELVYAYEVRHVLDGKQLTMRGVVVLVHVDPEYEQVLPHENVFDKPVDERLGLLAGTAFDLEPILMTYSGTRVGESMWAYLDGSGRQPDIESALDDGSTHRLWRVVDPTVVSTIVHGFKGRKAYIADGHHRYATHIRYAQQRRASEYRAPRRGPYDYKVAVMVNAADPGIRILPTHRIIMAAPRREPQIVFDAVRENFTHEPIGGEGDVRARVETALAKGELPTMAVYFGAEAGLHKVTAREAALDESWVSDRSFAWRAVEVSHLQYGLVEHGFGVDQGRWGDDVRYTQDWNDAIRSVDEGRAVAACFHRPVTPQQLRAVSDSHEAMPQKSTYYVPKIMSGAFVRRIGKQAAGREYRPPSS